MGIEHSHISFLFQTWERQTGKQFREAANAFKSARTKKDADDILKREGVRWSELLRLPYWDPTRFVTIDVMHNLFLNIVQFHIREVLQLEAATGGSGQAREATPKEMTAARKVWDNGNTTSGRLGRLSNPALIALCAENNVDLSEPLKALKKREIIVTLMVSLVLHLIE